MASAMRVFRKFRASDGRIKFATLSGVSALVAVIAMLVGVLPVFAEGPGSTEKGVNPVQVDWGGGDQACDDDLNSLEDEGGPARGPSAAEHELHINNPVPGTSTTYTGPDGTEITLTVDANDEFFGFSIEAGTGMAAYDVVVNGGQKSNHYAYDDPDPDSEIVPLDSDSHLSAPTKGNKDEVHKLSHVNICYDLDTQFECGVTEKRDQDGVFTLAEVTIFANSLWSCEDKLGAFAVDNDTENEEPDPSVLIDFGTGEGIVAGMATFTKDFGAGMPEFAPLKYSLTADGTAVEVSWCDIRDVVDNENESDLVVIEGEGDDPVNPFSEWLPNGKYPKLDTVTDDLSLADGALACKVYEEEDISGIQFTVVYFEFEDPQFR